MRPRKGSREHPARCRELPKTTPLRLVACCPCFETLASLAPQHEVVVLQQIGPHPCVRLRRYRWRRPPTGRANARPMTGSVAVSKDGLQYRFVIPGTRDFSVSTKSKRSRAFDARPGGGGDRFQWRWDGVNPLFRRATCGSID